MSSSSFERLVGVMGTSTRVGLRLLRSTIFSWSQAGNSAHYASPMGAVWPIVAATDVRVDFCTWLRVYRAARRPTSECWPFHPSTLASCRPKRFRPQIHAEKRRPKP